MKLMCLLRGHKDKSEPYLTDNEHSYTKKTCERCSRVKIEVKKLESQSELADVLNTSLELLQSGKEWK